MDLLKWIVYWIGYILLASIVLVFGTIGAGAILLLVGWQWLFEEAEGEKAPDDPMRVQRVS